MIKKIFSTVLFIFVFMFMGGLINVGSVQAAETYPNGCSSSIGYSVTTGSPCNGSINNAIKDFLPGCSSALGYSITNGAACSGGNEALSYLAGCTSLMGYSIFTGAPCNGTNIATFTQPVISPSTPGLPLTGSGGNALQNTILILTSGMFVVFGLVYLIRNPSLAKK